MKHTPLALALALTLALVVGACGRSASLEEAPWDPTVSPTVEAPVPDQAGPTFSDFPAEPPVWTLGYDETQEALNGWFWGYPDPEVDCDAPSFGGSASNPCVRSYFRSRGVSTAAIDLLFDRGISVFAIEGTGPVKVAQIADWEEILVGNLNLAAEADRYYVLTPMGKLDFWPTGSGAFDDPRAESALQALEDYFRTRPEFAEMDDSTAILEMGVGSYLSAPIQTADGWTIEIQSGIRAGCASCGIPFIQRSALLFAADGTLEEYRLIDVCYRPYDSGDSDKDAALSEIGTDLPSCIS